MPLQAYFPHFPLHQILHPQFFSLFFSACALVPPTKYAVLIYLICPSLCSVSTIFLPATQTSILLQHTEGYLEF